MARISTPPPGQVVGSMEEKTALLEGTAEEAMAVAKSPLLVKTRSQRQAVENSVWADEQ